MASLTPKNDFFHIGGRHPILYFTIQATEKCSAAMYYNKHGVNSVSCVAKNIARLIGHLHLFLNEHKLYQKGVRGNRESHYAQCAIHIIKGMYLAPEHFRK